MIENRNLFKFIGELVKFKHLELMDVWILLGLGEKDYTNKNLTFIENDDIILNYIKIGLSSRDNPFENIQLFNNLQPEPFMFEKESYLISVDSSKCHEYIFRI